jgi:hypothetical protein
MDYSKGWHEGMSLEDTNNLAYWERNMLALYLANVMNNGITSANGENEESGWYVDTDNNWLGWLRVISIDGGRITFHIPDDFDIGNLKQIEPNWNGHSTSDKWDYVKRECGVKS